MADGLTRTSCARHRRMFAEARDLAKASRDEAALNEKYYHGDQLTAEMKRQLAERRQPDVVFNHIRTVVNGTLGVLSQGEISPRAYGRNPQDEQSADVASKALRFICDRAMFSHMRTECARDYLVAGTTAVTIGADEDGQVTIDRIPWNEFFYDPRSRAADFSDARYLGVAKWVYADFVSNTWPEAATRDGLLDASLDADESLQDRPRDNVVDWIDKRGARVLLVEMYYNDGSGWARCVFTGAGMLQEGPSPFLDAKGKPGCPIIAQSCYIDGDNLRYGIVSDLRDPQDELNRRRQKLLHLVNSTRAQSMPNFPDAVMADADTVRAEAARPDGVLPVGWQIANEPAMAQGQFELLRQSQAEMERLGPNPAILGRQGADTSGRALIARQDAGMTEQVPVFDGLESWTLRVFRGCWQRARQYWTAPAWVRVTDDNGAANFIGINQPIHGEAMVAQDPQTGMATIMRPILGYQNRIAELDVDIVLDAVRNSPTFQHEQFMGLLDLAKSGVPIPPMLLLEASSLPGKAELIEKMKAAQSQPDPEAEARVAAAAAKTDKTKAETAYIGAKAVNESMQPHLDALHRGYSGGAQVPAAGG